MKNLLQFLIFFALLLPISIQAQVTIGSNAAPDENALLDLKQDGATNKGLLLPRVALTSTTSFAPLTAHVSGMTVYNTATAGDVTPGYYYNDGAKWVRLIDALPTINAWKLSGNAGTDPSINFLGTTDNKDLIFKRNNIFAGKIADRNVSLGVNSCSNKDYNDNVFIGSNAGQVATSSENTAVGSGALKSVVSSSMNTAVGFEAASSITVNHTLNTAVGRQAMKLGTGQNNTYIGGHAGYETTGNGNIAIGYNALEYTLTGNQNVIIGYNARSSFKSGHNNIVIGSRQLISLNDAKHRLNIGGIIFGNDMTGGWGKTRGRIGIRVELPMETLHVKGTTRIDTLPTSGTANAILNGDTIRRTPFNATRTVVADANGVLGTVPGLPDKNFWSLTGNLGTTPGTNYLGTNDAQSLMFKVNNTKAGYIDVTNRKNTAFGRGALSNVASGITAASNVAIGDSALYALKVGFKDATPAYAGNVAVGDGAMKTGDKNSLTIAIGAGSMAAAQNSWNNTAIGNNVMEKLNGGTLNIGIGGIALGNLTSGGHNVAVGLGAGNAVTTGDGNITFGYMTGNNITTGHYNIVMGGHQVNAPNATGNFQLNIGNLITGTGLAGGVGGASETFTEQEKIQKIGIAQASNLISEVLDVNGTTRIRSLPTSGTTNSVYTKTDGTTSATKDQTFTATRTVVADANGVLGTVPGLPDKNFWSLTGNTGTDPANNFLGTIDDKPLKLRIHNTVAGEINKQNTYLGYQSIPGSNNETNTVIGTYNMNFENPANDASSLNTVLGAYNLVSITGGTHNVAVGTTNMQQMTTGSQNVAVGYGSLSYHTSGSKNVSIGGENMANLTTGSHNTSLGAQAMTGRLRGNYNLALGFSADSRTDNVGDGNIAIGYSAQTIAGTTSKPINGHINIGNVIYGLGAFVGTNVGSSNLKRIGINLNNIPDGIFETIPTETFDVSGTMRVRALPNHEATNAINTKPDGTADAENAAPNQTFTATRTVVADANGVIGTVPGLPNAQTDHVTVTIDNAKFISGTGAGSTQAATTVTLGCLTIAFEWVPTNDHLILKIGSCQIQNKAVVNMTETDMDNTPTPGIRSVGWLGQLTANAPLISTGKFINGKRYGRWSGTILLPTGGELYRLTAATTTDASNNMNRFTFRLEKL